jgi:hypothetical protein
MESQVSLNREIGEFLSWKKIAGLPGKGQLGFFVT